MAEAGIPDPARRARQYPHEFSGGMRQRVLIAMALAAEPDLLLADEPTSALDVTVQRRILDHLAGLTDARGTAMLLITHDLALAAERADRVVVMHEGHVVETGPAERILTRPDDDYTRRLVAAAPAIGGGTRAADPPAPPRPVRVVTGLVREFRVRGSRERVRAVDDVSFTVDAGTTTALVGESGAGKTTTARIVLGLDRPTAGTGTVAGTDPFRSSRRDRAMVRRTMQPVFQDPYGSLDPTSTVARIVDEPLRVLRIGTPRRGATGSPSSWTRWPCRREWQHVARTSCPAASGSGSRSPGRWPPGRSWSCATRPSPPWTCWCRSRSWSC